MMMFAFAQTYNMSPSHFTSESSTSNNDSEHASIAFAIIFIVMGVAWPIGLFIALYLRNKEDKLFVV